MREPFLQLYVHLVWATWDRLPLLTSAVEARVYRNIQADCFRLGAEAMEIGGVEDHVHALVRLPATVTIAGLVKQVKGASSHLASHGDDGPPAPFKWQGGYGAFTVARYDLDRIRNYVRNQRAHHGAGTLEADLERTELPEP